MKNKLRNKVGSWVTGEDFWNREIETKLLIQKLDDYQNLLIVAPRRIGKTSLVRESLCKLADRGKDIGLFVDVQDCSNPEDVIVAISMATKPYQSIWVKIRNVFKNFFTGFKKNIDEVELDKVKLKIRQGVSGDWQEKGSHIFAALAESELPIILVMDELPVMINRMLRPQKNQITDENRLETEVFLNWLRNIMGEHQNHIRWIICGSIGLEPILNQCNLNHTIGHLRPFPLNPWDHKVAVGCLEALANHAQIKLNNDVKDKMLALLGCNISQYVQMFFGYLHDYCRIQEIEIPTVDDVNKVYEESMLCSRGHAELADLEERLHRVLGDQLVVLAIDLLSEVAVVGRLTQKSAITLSKYNHAIKKLPEPEKNLRTVLGVLEHDGYLKNIGTEYVFVSNLVRDWWRRRFSIGYIKANEREI